MIRRAAPTAIVCAIVLSASALAGCAKYNGDQAAFCAMLPTAPSFSQLASKMTTASPAQAATALDDAAVQFRAMERTAPRTIRAKIAALGDSAERLAEQLRSPEATRRHQAQNSATKSLPLSGHSPQGQTTYYYGGPSQSSEPYQLLLNEFANHPGTAEAARSLVNFAEDECGITTMDDPYSIYGVPRSGPVTPYGQQPNLLGPPNQYTVPGQPQTSLLPPATPSTTIP